ncbi:hypothetical protein OU426_11050 [Frigidibacter sp. RF13]|uniref:hypothetical protein n=1 Tax=Frigidibacter sp. RF13 TaxID=2997340 RepID=UPI00226D7DB1|nr:hypothetical protein [Frigidibacter sp. RF13]MCY1127391.1 hypothetical protein [Frigidibacter sp. RF13]
MAMLTLSSVGQWFQIDSSRRYWSLFGGPVLVDPVGQAEEARQRRAFLMDMLEKNPDGLSSEHDVQSMMSLYPGQF